MRPCIMALIIFTLGLPLWASADTTITYQGQLQRDDTPADATVEMVFTLHDSEDDGNQVAGPLTDNVTVTDGLFQVELDFGDAFSGERWLEIKIDNEALVPRQRVAPAPVAVRALNVAESANAWQLGGNTGTDPDTDYIGTNDETAFEIHVDNRRALRMEPVFDSTWGEGVNMLAGHLDNVVEPGVTGATIAGGGGGGFRANEVLADFGTVAGGRGNTADGFAESTVSGGLDNTAEAAQSTVSGGLSNIASGGAATIGGGGNNTANGDAATIGGGGNNTASGELSTIPGGRDNEASGNYSFAAGRDTEASGNYSFAFGNNANANRTGMVMFTDSNAGQPSTGGGTDRFIANFDGGYRLETDAETTAAGVWMGNGDTSWDSLSAREHKTNFESVDATAIVDAIVNLEVSRWTYDWQTDIDRIGPMAGEFYEAFGIGRDDDGIQTMDAIGVLYAAVQGLAERNAELESQINRVSQLQAENAELKERLAKLESVLLDDHHQSGGQP